MRAGTPPSSPSRLASSSSLDRSSESSLSRPCTESKPLSSALPCYRPATRANQRAPTDLNVFRLGLQLRPRHGCSSAVPSPNTGAQSGSSRLEAV